MKILDVDESFANESFTLTDSKELIHLNESDCPPLMIEGIFMDYPCDGYMSCDISKDHKMPTCAYLEGMSVNLFVKL